MTVESVPRRLVVGRYVLEREIGSGGMASVYLGHLHGPVGFSRVVAIKRLHPQYAKDSSFAAAFIDEARLAARIAHANVVQVLDVLLHEGELLVVMELIRGETLSRIMKLLKAPLPVDVAGKIALDVLSGLHAAHEAKDEDGQPLQIVHRDVSPQNVIVGLDGTSRLIDFGVAKAIGRMQQTANGQMKGKIGYFAPETIRSGQVDRRVDVYAAGVMLWEMLVGASLFRGENELQVLSAILQGRVEPPSTRASGISPALDEVVMHALRSSPEERYASAASMADALDEVVVPARARQVGDWVARVAGHEIADRDAALSELVATLREIPEGASETERLMPFAPTVAVSPPASRDAPATEPAKPPITLALDSEPSEPDADD